MASEQYEYDAVIVGAGVMGALVAKKLTEAGKKVLILEAGRASGLSFASYQSYVETYRKAEIKDTNSPYVQNAMAPSPYERDIAKSSERTPDLNGYQVQKGPLPFGSTYLRSLGGTTLHWLGTCPRMLPSDFRLHSLYGVGRDWPIDYDEIAPYYCEAEWAIGVSANKEDQSYFGVHFPEDYDYPMERIPLSWSDLQIAAAVDGSTLRLGSQDYPVWVESLPQARNAIPRKGYTPQGAVGAEHLGQRCEGNASCIPICPVQAKYSALKTLSRLNPARATLRTQAVATALKLGADGRIAGIEVAQYADEAGALPVHRGTVRGRLYVLAAHAVENAKLLLASKAANRSDQVGRNLMDHPFFITWALAPKNLGMFRGPGQTAGIPSFRDGAFRRDFAAMRIDLGNWGWDVATYPPASDVVSRVGQGLYGSALRRQLADELPRQLRIGFDIEQLPESRNRVTISPEFMGPLGSYRPVLHYDLSDYTQRAMLAATEIADHVYRCMGIEPQNILSHYEPSDPSYTTLKHKGKTVGLSFIGAGHHMGTHRMGSSPKDSVTDKHSRAWDHDNLYIVGCGSMVTSGSANPTLTGAALSLMAADAMLRQLKQEAP
jgi:choline dehydrogenase-like flavoprotein